MYTSIVSSFSYFQFLVMYSQSFRSHSSFYLGLIGDNSSTSLDIRCCSIIFLSSPLGEPYWYYKFSPTILIFLSDIIVPRQSQFWFIVKEGRIVSEEIGFSFNCDYYFIIKGDLKELSVTLRDIKQLGLLIGVTAIQGELLMLQLLITFSSIIRSAFATESIYL